MTGTYVMRDGKLVPKHLAAPLHGPKLHIINDSCEIVSQADGRTYTSKRAYYASLRAQGREIVGNERPNLRGYEPNERAIEAVVASVMRGE